MDFVPPLAPAGWYADPAHRHEYRWWSGAIWTEHVSDGGVQSVDVLASMLAEANTPGDWMDRELWEGWGYPENAIRGESQYQVALIELAGPLLRGSMHFDPVEVELVREPDNPYDRFACKAIVAGNLIGYLARECASHLAPIVDAAGVRSWRVAGAIVGGGPDVPSIGVHLWLDCRLSSGPEWPPKS